jgi:hypothetical protein
MPGVIGVVQAKEYTPQTFAEALLTAIGAPVTKMTVADIMSWETAEGGHWANSAKYNPLNTTWQLNGSSPMKNNSAGVQSFKSWNDGITATVKTLTNGHYQQIIEELQRGGSLEFGQVVSNSPWGTNYFAITTQPKLPVQEETITNTFGLTNAEWNSLSLREKQALAKANPVDQARILQAVAGATADKQEGELHKGIYGLMNTAAGTAGVIADVAKAPFEVGAWVMKNWWVIILVTVAAVAIMLIVVKNLNPAKVVTAPIEAVTE